MANNGGPTVKQQQALSSDCCSQTLLNLPKGVPRCQVAACSSSAPPTSTRRRGQRQLARSVRGDHELGHRRHRRAQPPQSDATLDLTGSENPLAALGGAQGQCRCSAATADQAGGKNGAQSGHYEIASLKLMLTSPALASADQAVTAGTSKVPGLSSLISTLAGAGLPVGTLEKVGTNDPVTALTQASGVAGQRQLRRRCDHRQPHRRHAHHRRREAAQVGAEPRPEQLAAEHPPHRDRREGAAARRSTNGLAGMQSQLQRRSAS